MASHQISSFAYLLVVFFSAFTFSSCAHQFIVGGKDGWVLNPTEDYNHWAERLRFQVNDTLLFKYKKGSDSVLVVNRDDFVQCNTGNPLIRMDDGNSVFKFNRSGPFFFLSGNKSNCAQGQKLIIIVLAVRNRRSPPPSDAPSPAAPSEAPTPSPIIPPGQAPGWGGSPSFSPAGAPGPTTGRGGSNSPGGSSGGGPEASRSFATPAGTPSFILLSIVSLVSSVGLGGFIIS